MTRAAHEVPPAVHWEEGMLLAPQHFQLASNRQEALLHFHASVVSPFHWGLVDFKRERLSDGVITVTRAEGLMPDGLIVTHPRRDGRGAADLSIDLKPRISTLAKGPHTVFLAAASRQPGERFKQRYDSNSDQVLDETTGLDDLPVKVLNPKLQLVLFDYLPDSFVGFPIAKVELRGGDIVETEYEPPWLRVQDNSTIYELCTGIANVLRAKAVSLHASIAQQSSSARGPQLIETRMLIHSLVSGLPVLEGLLQTKAAHPFSLYLALASIVGNLAPGVLPDPIPAYDHDHLLLAFRAIQNAIGDTIVRAIRAPYTIHPFVLTDNVFRLRVEPGWTEHRLMLGVRMKPGLKPKDVDEWIVNSTIGASKQIDSLQKLRATGVKRERMRDAEMLPASGDVFYELKERPLYDGHILALDELVISSGDHERRPDQIVLYVNTEG